MSRYAKIALIAALSMATMGCAFLQSAVDEAYKQSGDQSQPQSQTVPENGQAIVETQVQGSPEDVFDTNIPTEVILPNDQVAISKKMTVYSPLLESYRTYLLLENKNTDPEDIIVEISYTMTWFDDQNKVVDQWVTTNDPHIFPQEYYLLEPWVDRTKGKEHKITRARFELMDIKTIKTGWTDEELKSKIRSQQIKHPFMTIQPEAFRVEKPAFMESMTHAETRATVQSSMNTKVGAMVVVFYLNASNEMVGVGKSAVEIAPLGSVTVDIPGIHLTEAPTSAEYHVVIAGPKELERVIYP